MASPYAVFGDIQDAMFLTFSDSTPTVPTETQVTAMIAEWANFVDALDQNTTASEGSKKNAVILAVTTIIEARRKVDGSVDFKALRETLLQQLKTDSQQEFTFLSNENTMEYFEKMP